MAFVPTPNITHYIGELIAAESMYHLYQFEMYHS